MRDVNQLKVGRTDWILLIVLSILWGSSFAFIDIALQSLPVFTIVFLRVSIAALILTVYLYLNGHRLPGSVMMWRRFIVLGMLRAALPISLIVWAETRIDSGLAGILNSTSPLFTAIIAHFLTHDDKLTGNRLLGIAIGMLGVGVLIGVDALQGLGSRIPAQFAMLGATCSYGFAAVYGRRFRDTSPVVSAAGMLIGSSILILPLAIVEDPWLIEPTLAAVSAILGLSVFSTAVAFIVWFQLIFRVGASNTAMVTFLIPITALLLGVTVLGERIEISSLTGLGIILFGLVIFHTRRRPQRKT